VNHGSYWELDLGGDDVTLSSSNGNTLVLTAVQPIFDGQGRVIETATVVLPDDARNIRVENGVIKYELPYEEGGRKPLFLGIAGAALIGLILINVPLKRG
jgi:hypothetical protein